jgi:TolB-like protein/DNA-binding winged helix-turn-helix (wHTH) protein/cytochrome c-type biogenesis protein CcmH/NrfG
MPMMGDVPPDTRSARIDLSETGDFDLGGLRVSPAHREVQMNGERRELEPRVAQVLVALASARPGVVSRDRLIEQCWDGRIVGDDALNRCIVALRHLAKEFSPEPFTIETVPRVGYCLVEKGSAGRAAGIRANRKIVAAALLAILLIGALTIGWWRFGRSEPAPASIAVMSFRNLSTGDPYFAEGIGEEIVGQLASEPQFRVAGRASSRELGPDADAREVARRLNVEYVVEGSVRRQGDRVRVNAGLVRASDGIRLWSDSYDGRLDDIFAIQQRIGAAIAGALKRKLVRAPPLSGPLVTKGEAYNLYLTARSLIRTRNRRVGPTAVALLRDAVRIDPGYAPAWASLAEATTMQGALGDRETFIAAIRKAQGYARHALRLAPDLAEAHRVLGSTLGHGDPQGVAYLRRAVALDSNNSENLIGLGTALRAEGDFERELTTYRQAMAIDPLWYRTTGLTAITLAEMGERSEAEAVVGRGLPDKGANLNIALGRIAWTFADYSEAARQWAVVVKSNSPRWANTAQRTLHDATYGVGVRTGPIVDVPEPPAIRSNWRVWMDAPPSPAEWRKRNRDPIATEVYRKPNLLAAKLMLNSGRWRELVVTFDSPVGLFGLAPGRRVRVDQVAEAPIAALALRLASRGAEADRLLREAEAAVRTAHRRGRVPVFFDADAATILAVQGRKAEALTALELAFRRGWRQNGYADVRDIRDEPAFHSLQGDPRFERLRARIAAHYARERAEILRLNL